MTQSNLESPWTFSSLPLELPVLRITETVDFIKPLTKSKPSTKSQLTSYLITKLFTKTKLVETLPTQKCKNTFRWPSSDASLCLLPTHDLW